MIEVRINPKHPVAAKKVYPLADPPMTLTDQWQKIPEKTKQLEALTKAYTLADGTVIQPIAEIKGSELVEPPKKPKH